MRRAGPLAVAVVGPGEVPAGSPLLESAYAVGAGLGRRGVLVVTGGLGGVMAAACRGALEHGGHTLGLLPGEDRTAANPWVEVAVPTGLGQGRNLLVVRAADAVIAVGGSWGTLAEISLARRRGVPVIGLATWSVIDAGGQQVPQGSRSASDPEEAVGLALSAAGG